MSKEKLWEAMEHVAPELIEEGFLREMVSKIQTMRKEAGFEVMDHIALYEEGSEKIETILKTNEETVRSEVMADRIEYGKTAGYVKEWNINGEKVTLGVEKLNG